MDKLLIKSRRNFIQNVAFSGVAFALSQSVLAAEVSSKPIVLLPQPLNVELLPQPDAKVSTLAAFSHLSKRVVVAAGILENASLYVNSMETPKNFEVLWSTTGSGSQIHTMAWSPDENIVAFIATSLNLGGIPKSAKISLYVANVASRDVRELIKIEEVIGQAKKTFTNINWRGNLTWYNNAAICVCSEDNAVLTIDRNTGQIGTLIEPQDGGKICSIAKTQSNELRFMKNKILENGKSGIAANICGFQTDGIADYGKIALNADKILLAKLSPDGDYAFLHTLTDLAPKVKVYDLNKKSIIKEIPAFTQDSLYYHLYAPIAVLEKRELVLLDMVLLSDEAYFYFKSIQENPDTKAMLPLSFDFSRKPSCKLVKVAL